MTLLTRSPPFADVLGPWLRTQRRPGPACEHIGETAWAGAEAALTARLAAVAGPTLLSLFDARRTLPPAARLLDTTPDTAPRAAYMSWVDGMAAVGLAAVLAPWPVLLDRVGRIVRDWDDAMAEFARHLTADAPKLRRSVPGWTEGVPAVTDLRFGLSDPHAGGRTVGRVGFADGTVLAYKPRSLAVEAAFSRLLRELSADGGAPDQRAPLVIDRGDHGWMEWIVPAPCRTGADATAFFRRCGGLLALMRALRGGDIHPDNLIAAGAHPVIVDLECLFQPGPADLRIPDPLLDPLVFQAGILPVFTSFDGGRTLAPVAAAGAGTLPLRPERRMIHAGTDWMHAADRPVPSFDGPGPVLDGAALDVRDFAGPLADGYRRTLALLAGRREAMLARGGALHRFGRARVRFLAAPTNLYALLLDTARSPQLLAQEARFRASLARAAGRPKLVGGTGAWNAILAAEAAALDRLDVPAFHFRPASRQVRAADGTRVGPVTVQPMAGRITADLRALTPAGIAAESRLVAASLRRPAAPLAPVDGADPRAVLRRLTDRIADLAVRQADGIGWVRMWEQMPALVAPAGPGLCYGGTGIALALAEASRVLDDDGSAKLARRALRPWRALIRRGEGDRLAARIGPGWGRGLGGLIAGLAWCADLLGEPAMLTAASTLVDAVPAALRAGPGVPDLLDGAAGLAVGLSVLHHRRPGPAVTGALRACGRVILDRSRLSGPLRDWPDRGRPGLAGLSHGAGGIAIALAHIQAAAGGRRWQAAVGQALEYEGTLFDPDQGNWRHLGGGPGFKTTWCHGAPGIALARQAVADLLPGRLPDQEPAIGAALDTTRRSPLTDVDDLCCGEAGRLEILMTLAARRNDAAVGSDAAAAVGVRLPDWAAGRAKLLALQAGAPDDPSLYRGMAGLAHVLVRHLAPDLAAPVLLPI